MSRFTLAITRYISYEGSMHIREQATSNEIISSDTYLKLQLNDSVDIREYEIPMNLSSVYSKDGVGPFHKTFHKKIRFKEHVLDIKSEDYIPNAKDSLIANPKEKPVLSLVLAGQEGRITSYFESGDIKNLGGTLFCFNRNDAGMVQIFSDGTNLKIYSPFEGEYMTMATQAKGKVYADSLQDLVPRSLYQLNNTRFVIPDFPKGGHIEYYSGSKKEDLPNVVKLNISSGKDSRSLYIKGGGSLFGQHSNIPEFNPDSIGVRFNIAPDHAEKFGGLLVQDFQGRVKPINTMALEVLRKVYGKDKIYGLDANQFFIAVHSDLSAWLNAPIIKVGKKGGKELNDLVKANEAGYTTMINLIDISKPDGGYILGDLQRKAFAKDPSRRSEYDKEIIKLDERFQILNGIPTGTYLRIIPIKNDLNNTWTSWMTADTKIDSTASDFFKKYFSAVGYGLKTGKWNKADLAVKSISDYQKNWGGIMLLLSFAELFSNSTIIKWLIRIFLGLGLITFVLHAVGLGVRWYISGHAPWSNGYEAVIFISWIGVLAGLLLYRNRNSFIPTTGFLVAVIMMGFAHGGSLLDPQITPLVPVLKSYWLLIHVAIITSSYGFFGLGFVLSIITLVMFILQAFNKNPRIDHSIKELGTVNEMTLTIGVFALTIGTFLGGIWANESWGRYWSWDPKETWAFISVIVYAFVLHMRLIPGLRGRLSFSIGSLWAFSSIVFTYIGVNYFLSGLHSYATGDPIQIPIWVHLSVLLLLLLCVTAGAANYVTKKSSK
ncbi:unnamed protein product [Cyprideis torosa]|uniref:Uncharacterized protein n=1 Tax=Cyprideis torosa TaxID=163714 RepID=A0A7R8WQ36_9CRUS|nr:unnamed protein product [Cyprideis torosa]CAG0902021.1 unnamed protein product [Cyprideis torosa]